MAEQEVMLVYGDGSNVVLEMTRYRLDAYQCAAVKTGPYETQPSNHGGLSTTARDCPFSNGGSGHVFRFPNSFVSPYTDIHGQTHLFGLFAWMCNYPPRDNSEL
jgi:hypothetical protein